VFGKFKSEQPSKSGKEPILGQGHGLSNEEGDMIKQMIRNEQHSSRELFIPQQDLAQEATTSMSPPTAQVIEASQIRPMLELFNRDFLYGQGRFDAYKDGLIFKWGDGYSRRHIWASVENGNLLLETSHAKKCDKPYCNGTHHVLTPDLYTNHALINQELGDLFRRPVYESPED
jgi:hypothetical protein